MLKKFKKVLGVFCAACMLAASASAMPVAHAQTGLRNECGVSATGEGVEPRGLFVNVSIALDCGNGKVWVTAKNEFTLFPATVKVELELYSSDAYCSSYEQMTLVDKKTVDDLNIGESFNAEAFTEGKTKYWCGRMKYRVDKKDWKTSVTGIYQIDGNGNVIK